VREYTVDEFQVAAANLVRQIDAALAEAERRLREHRGREAELQQQRNEALGQLVRVILPAFSAAALARAGRVAGFGRLLIAEETTGRLERERAELGAHVAELEADPRWIDRARLRAPRVGTLVRELEELEEFRKPLVEVVALAAHERLAHLLAVGYGTDEYKVGFWRVSYYADWKAGDEIVERFPDKASFAVLRPELCAARDGLEVYDQRIAELRAELAAAERIEQELDAAATRLANLEALHLAEWHTLLAAHLAETDLAELGDRLGGAEAAQLLAKTYAGLTKKQEYMAHVFAEQIEKPMSELRAERQKLEADRWKYARPKKAWTRFPADKFERRFRDRGARFDKHWHRYDRTCTTIWSFDRYERASFAEDFLWWDLMTDGRIDGNFIPEVYAFHHTHPDYAWQGQHGLDDELAAAAAQATAAADQTMSDGGGALDPS
jgi:hypothetical protein